jgi:hypothetical protein
MSKRSNRQSATTLPLAVPVVALAHADQLPPAERMERMRYAYKARRAMGMRVFRTELQAAEKTASSGRARGATLTVEQLHWLLEGIDIAVVQRHPQRLYERVA